MNRYFILAITIALCACSKPTDTVIPSSIDKMDSIKPQLEKLSPEQRELFDKYILRHTPSKKRTVEAIPVGITIGKAIEAQSAFKLVEDAAIKSAKNKLESYLSDPSSVQYGKVYALYSKEENSSNEKTDGIFEVCFEFNAKNKMGGYVGSEKEMCYVGMADNKCVNSEFRSTLEDRLKKEGITRSDLKDLFRDQGNALNAYLISLSCSTE